MRLPPLGGRQSLVKIAAKPQSKSMVLAKQGARLYLYY